MSFVLLQTVSEFHSLYNEAVNRDINQYIGIEEYIDKAFQYSYHCHEATLSLAYEEVVSVSVALTVVYVILATAGLVFAVVCILFNLFFRQKRLV